MFCPDSVLQPAAGQSFPFWRTTSIQVGLLELLPTPTISLLSSLFSPKGQFHHLRISLPLGEALGLQNLTSGLPGVPQEAFQSLVEQRAVASYSSSPAAFQNIEMKQLINVILGFFSEVLDGRQMNVLHLQMLVLDKRSHLKGCFVWCGELWSKFLPRIWLSQQEQTSSEHCFALFLRILVWLVKETWGQLPVWCFPPIRNGGNYHTVRLWYSDPAAKFLAEVNLWQ